MYKLSQKLDAIKGIGPYYLKRFKKLKLETVEDLIYYFPFRYDDFSQIKNIEDLVPGETATIGGEILEIKSRRTWKKRMFLTEAIIQDLTGAIKAIWFNQPFIARNIKKGQKVSLAGKVLFEDGIYFSSPVYEIIRPGLEINLKHTAGFIPVYPETRGLTSKAIRFFINKVLEKIEKIPDALPQNLKKKYNLPEINQTLKQIHFPKDKSVIGLSNKRLAFEDLFLLQLTLIKNKLKLKKQLAPKIKEGWEIIKNWTEKLPYELTEDQKKIIFSIGQDLFSGKPMNRLLQGDVGSGKTVVAAAGAILTLNSGYQVGFMSPTEILARQHFKTITKELLKDFSWPVILCIAKEKRIFDQGLDGPISKNSVLKILEGRKPCLVIGTQAIIQKEINFKKLGLVVIDEQHRFGVDQRAHLTKQDMEITPHLLSLTATPIPRTLTLTLYGDLDISVLKQMPKGRREIKTSIIPPTKRKEAYDFIREEIKKDHRAFVVCPRIEKDETDISMAKLLQLEIRTVKKEYEKLSKKIFPDLSVGMIHGKMKSAEKDEIMTKFKSGEIKILVSTTVIEVGIDIPEATVILIEGAERFGLAQLHQLRGRVGRSCHQSYCFLFTESPAKQSNQRLKALTQTMSGFELAEKDLEIRGPGELFGTMQSGWPDLAMKAIKNPELVEQTKNEALDLLKKDVNLKSYPVLKNKLEEFRKKIHLE